MAVAPAIRVNQQYNAAHAAIVQAEWYVWRMPEDPSRKLAIAALQKAKNALKRLRDVK